MNTNEAACRFGLYLSLGFLTALVGCATTDSVGAKAGAPSGTLAVAASAGKAKGIAEPAMALPAWVADLKGKQVAVVVYPAPGSVFAKAMEKAAQARLESVLDNNSVTVLDEAKVKQLKSSYTKMEDPNAFLTAEDLMAISEKFKVVGVVALYLHAAATPGLADYSTATASADIRFIGEGDAKVRALATRPMGVPGMPPSDGLTADAALKNAVQRAVDDACRKLGLGVPDPVTPSTVALTLKEVAVPSTTDARVQSPESDNELIALAKMENQRWRKEQVTGTRRAPGGGFGAVAGYILDTDFTRKPQRLYGSRVHLVDVGGRSEVTTFECHPVEMKAVGMRGTVKVLDLAFVSNWRYLAAVTGNELFFWDTERGRLMASVPLRSGADAAQLAVVQGSAGSMLIVNPGKPGSMAFKIARPQ
jgi:hypothetical protein